jgi:hypothetical protein
MISCSRNLIDLAGLKGKLPDMVDFRGSMLDSSMIGSEVGWKKGGMDEERWERDRQ